MAASTSLNFQLSTFDSRREAAPLQAQAPAAAPPSAHADAAPEMSARAEPQEAPDRELSAKAAKPSAARKAAAPEALGHAGGVAAGAAPRVQSRKFERCEGELRRFVRVDADGRVVEYVREGTFDGRRLRIHHAFGQDGSLAQVTAEDERGRAVDPGALGVDFPQRAEDAALDAPPRCGR